MHTGIANLKFPLKSAAMKTPPAFPAHAQPAILRIRLEAHIHWGWTHEGVGRHPRQHGGGLSHRLGKLQANLQTQRIYWRPILIEAIFTGMRNIWAELPVVIGSQSAVIPIWKIAWWREWCTFQFSWFRGWLFSMSRVTTRWTRVTRALIGQTVMNMLRFYFRNRAWQSTLSAGIDLSCWSSLRIIPFLIALNLSQIPKVVYQYNHN